MRTAITLRDIIGKTKRVFMERIRPCHCQFNRNIITFAIGDDRGVKRIARPVQIIDKGRQAAIEIKFGYSALGGAFIGEPNPNAAIQKSQLAKPMFQCAEFKINMRKNFGRWHEGNMRAALTNSVTNDF